MIQEHAKSTCVFVVTGYKTAEPTVQNTVVLVVQDVCMSLPWCQKMALV